VWHRARTGLYAPAPLHIPTKLRAYGLLRRADRMEARKNGSWQRMVTYIIVLLIIGLIAGAVARLLVPGRDRIGFFGTILLGVVGSFVGGFLWNLIEYHKIAPHKFHTVGIIGSILGAIIVLILLRLSGMERGHRRSRSRRFRRA
jgi:uncharacterized membrane protein YeaQ/YmgE (transglycosylase-associated protein family)